MLGRESSARTSASPIRWVKETLPPRPRARWLLMTMRLSAMSFAGTARTLVAVGTVSDWSMFATIRAVTPRSCVVRGPPVGFAAVAGRAAEAGFGVAAGFGAVTGRAGAAGAVVADAVAGVPAVAAGLPAPGFAVVVALAPSVAAADATA